MAKEEAGGDEIEAAPPPPRDPVTYTRRKRMRTGGASGSPAAASGGAGMCDDVLRGIFARVPARTAVASMAVSRHHQALLRCPEFRALHCRLALPLPGPHVAYIATAKVKGGRKQPASGYHGFHVAGAGLSGTAPMRALAGAMCPRMKYVGTCNGVVLLVYMARPGTCVLWNPAIADDEKEVTVPVSDDDECAVLGLGYGRRSKTYKLLLSRRRKVTTSSSTTDIVGRRPQELLVCALPKIWMARTLSSEGLELEGEISGESLYLDGTIYLLHVDKAVILAFDVDDETVAAIDLPGAKIMPTTLLAFEVDDEPVDHEPVDNEPVDDDPVDDDPVDDDPVDDEPVDDGAKIMSTTLLLISGRPCVDTQDSHGRALWLLTVDHQWERKCIIEDKVSIRNLDPYSIIGVWDCGGVLFMYLRYRYSYEDDGKLFMYCTATKKMVEVDLPCKLMPPMGSEHSMCWGYKPTLVSPGSMVGSQDEDEEKRRARTADIMAALMPLNERDRRKGHKATLHTVCFMDFLVRIMQKLPENMDEVAQMPLLKSDGSEKGLYYSDSDSESRFEARFMTCYRKAKRMRVW